MSLPHLILGLLKYGPQSGYDLNKFFRASVEHFWSTEQSQVYRALYKLRDAGWVEIEEVIQENLPDKKLYHLTNQGEKELEHWLATPQDIASAHEGWLGQIFFGSEQSKEHLKQVLERRISDLRQKMRSFEQDIPTSIATYTEMYHATSDSKYWLLTLNYGLQKLHFELQWALDTLASLEQLSEGDEHE